MAKQLQSGNLVWDSEQGILTEWTDVAKKIARHPSITGRAGLEGDR